MQVLINNINNSGLYIIIVPEVNTKYGQRSFSIIGPRLLNRLPAAVTSSVNVNVFKVTLKTYLFNLSVEEIDTLVN